MVDLAWTRRRCNIYALFFVLLYPRFGLPPHARSTDIESYQDRIPNTPNNPPGDAIDIGFS
jgi:hypothetical protein